MTYLLFIVLGGPTILSTAHASEDSPKADASFDSEEEPSKKSSVKTEKNGSEDDDSSVKISANISAIRSVNGEYDVFFVGKTIGYSVPASIPGWKNKEQTPDEYLNDAFKHQKSVTVTVDTNTDTITEIEGPQTRSPSSEGVHLPPELEYLKDIIKKQTP